MDSRTQLRFLPLVFASLAAAALVATGCSSGSNLSNITNPATETGSSFVVGTDAPMASVVSFSVQLQAVNAIDASGKSVSLISGTPTVDFARYNGLQTLLDMNDVTADTYTSIQIVLGPATIGYLNTSAGAAPTIATESAIYPQGATTYTITDTLTNPLVVTQSGSPVGLHMDFDLRKSIGVDSTGAITGDVTPTFNINTVASSDSGAYIDEFDAAVVTVASSGQSFTITGPHGRTFTVNVTGQTEWENNESISDLTSSSIVVISGTLDRADATIDADCIGVLSQNGFYAGGQITYVTPSSGPATSFDLYVRGLLPTTTGLALGDIAQVDLSGNENYFIYWWHNPLTHFIFNSSLLLPGQHVSVGGPATGATNPNDVTVKRVVLRHWGYNSTVVANSVNDAEGTFQIQVNGFAGLLVPQTVTVYTAPGTQWRDGLTGIGSLTGGANVRVVGLLIKDPTSGNTCLLAHYIDALD
ncbi:MAG: DUF4382 domain-containing protein [Terracidiphilus sp.]|jgi:hypothetical protein